MRLFSLTLGFLVVLTLLSPALSCSCPNPPTFQKLYCRSNTAFRGTVLARTDNCPGKCDPLEDQGNGEIYFIVRVDHKFKGPAIEDNLVYLRTQVNDALCGTELGVGVQYMFNMRKAVVREGQCPSRVLDVSLCDFVVTWSSLSKQLRRFVIRNANTDQSLCKRLPSPESS